jgi:hypothetical protein
MGNKTPQDQNVLAHDARPGTPTWVANQNRIYKQHQTKLRPTRPNCQDQSDKQVQIMVIGRGRGEKLEKVVHVFLEVPRLCHGTGQFTKIYWSRPPRESDKPTPHHSTLIVPKFLRKRKIISPIIKRII